MRTKKIFLGRTKSGYFCEYEHYGRHICGHQYIFRTMKKNIANEDGIDVCPDKMKCRKCEMREIYG